MRIYGAVGLLAIAVLTGCAGPAAAPNSTPTATATPTATPTGLPTYSAVVATYPSGVDKCDTVADLAPGGYKITGGSVQFHNGRFDVLCYGVKITVKAPTTVKGRTYAKGTKLTVDAKKNLAPVSSWD